MFMGLAARMVNAMVASSLPVGGSGMLHCGKGINGVGYREDMGKVLE